MTSNNLTYRLRSQFEEQWVSYQPYLLQKGYLLRPRYQPDWVPSWEQNKELDAFDCEDSIDSMPVRVLDAIRIKDDLQVVIKITVPAEKGREGLEELELLHYFSSPPLKDDPSNHVVPCLDSFPIPDNNGYFTVMPLLGKYSYPPFYNLAEIHDFLQQIFEGLLFMHGNNVAHCDIASNNIMMNARILYDEPFHPFHQKFSPDIKRHIYPRRIRSHVRIRYYYIDLGYSKWFKDPSVPQTIPADQARVMAPEQVPGNLYDPFVGDVFQLGAIIGRDLLQKIDGLEFLRPLAMLMTKQDPQERPSLKEAQTRMNTAFLGLSGWKYRWPLTPENLDFKVRFHLTMVGVLVELRYWVRKLLSLLTSNWIQYV